MRIWIEYSNVVSKCMYQRSRPSASGIELIELGGMTPTSVTTAVMVEGGVRS